MSEKNSNLNHEETMEEAAIWVIDAFDQANTNRVV